MVNDSTASLSRDAESIRGWSAVDASEIAVVERMIAFATRHQLRPLAAAATRVGNGWLYLFALFLLVPARSEVVLRCAATSAVSMAAAFTLYPLLKRLARRLRPCELRPQLRSSVRPLDRFSFPSGHAMTAAACGAPFVFTWFWMAALVVIPVWAVISWSRMALGHHYPTDVLAGTILGVSVAIIAAVFMS